MINWEAIGAIGEVAGAIGVIVTLIYLAIQIRHNTRSSRLASFQSTTEMLTTVNTLIAGNDEIAEIFSRIYNEPDVELTPKERIKFTFTNLCLFRAWETAYFQRSEGMALQQSWLRYEQSICAQIAVPRVKEWWLNNTFGFTKEFRDYVQSIIEEQEGRDRELDLG